MYINTKSIREAQDLDALLTANRERKPFRTCYQCRNSRFVPDGTKAREFVCKKPRHKQEEISPSGRVAGCPYAERHNNTDALSRDTLLILSHVEAEGKG